jgi:hypothetical protein
MQVSGLDDDEAAAVGANWSRARTRSARDHLISLVLAALVPLIEELVSSEGQRSPARTCHTVA